jgi:hypothetical protein
VCALLCNEHAHAVCHWLLTALIRVWSEGDCGVDSGNRTGFSPKTPVFSCQYFYTNAHCLLVYYSVAGRVGRLSAPVPRAGLIDP